jgi:pimeloyl-ACP methyl ester carboxylesterase
VICLPGYVRNMADFTEFAGLLQQAMQTDWPVVLLDLRGRGRSADRRRADDYVTTADARDLIEVARALAIEQAIFVGQGHGGQVVMALAAVRPALVGGAVLIDAGPVAAPQSLIRLRSNMQAIAGSRGTAGVTIMLRRMRSADYPRLDRETIDRLVARTHLIDARGHAVPLFDNALIERLRDFAFDDVLVPQWQLFDVLARAPLLLIRTELTDQLPRELLDEMRRRRPDAGTLTINDQGSPALLDDAETVKTIAEFVRAAARPAERPARRT